VTDTPQGVPPTVIPKKKMEVAPGFPTLLNLTPPVVKRTTVGTSGRRSALARWITDPDNPLAARVIVNRVWQHHFGQGLAPNTSDFGRLGGPPSHSELLDWLANTFVENGWRLKPLHRQIVLSAVYRQSTVHPQFDEFQAIDPLNRMYWRRNTRRLDAEQIRDSLLAISGELDLTAGGPGAHPEDPRRTIYTRVMRNARDPLLDVFDLPQFIASTAARNATTTPIQSLLLINGQSLVRFGALVAERARKSAGGRLTPEAIAEAAWQIVYGRRPTSSEMADAVEFLKSKNQATSEPALATTSEVVTGNLPYRSGQAVMLEDSGGLRLRAPMNGDPSSGAFTIEAFFQLRSISGTAALRTLAATWDGNRKSEGWTFGVTGVGSRRKAQTLALVAMVRNADGAIEELPFFSDQHVEVGKPYFAAVAFRPAGATPGEAVFFLKDLSDDDEPLQVRRIPHGNSVGALPVEALGIGQRLNGDSRFDGLIDDVRWSAAAFDVSQLLLSREGVGPSPLGYWRFEPDPGIFRDSSAMGHHIDEAALMKRGRIKSGNALAALCHVLLNTSEFLYVD